jgi:hypothetical protein
VLALLPTAPPTTHNTCERLTTLTHLLTQLFTRERVWGFTLAGRATTSTTTAAVTILWTWRLDPHHRLSECTRNDPTTVTWVARLASAVKECEEYEEEETAVVTAALTECTAATGLECTPTSSSILGTSCETKMSTTSHQSQHSESNQSHDSAISRIIRPGATLSASSHCTHAVVPHAACSFGIALV